MKVPRAATTLVRRSSGEQVYHHVRRAIESGQLKPGQALLSVRDLQDELDVSFHAVLMGIKRLELEGYVARKRGSGTYVRDLALNQPLRSQAKSIALFAPPGGTPAANYLRPLQQAVCSEVESLGSRVNVSPDDFHANEREKAPAAPDADAVIWVCPSAPQVVTVPARPPYVLVSQDCESLPAGERGFDVVTADSRQGGALAGRYLREAGCRRAMFVGVRAPTADGWELRSRLRLEGFEIGWGASLPKENLVRLKDYMFVAAITVGGEIFKQAPDVDGIFAASDDLAMGFCHAALAHGVALGKAVKLVGFDGQPARFVGDPKLTTVAVPLEAMGRMAARLALERAENPQCPARRISLACSLRKADTA